MSNKSSQLDYIPTSLLKSCADIFSILISHLANLSFTQATFPSKFKLALISPLLKKPGSPKSELSNFRPISNLNTIGKILERLALARLFPHISISPSFCPLQSAYRRFHSTETALLKLTNDIMETIDSGKITILTALDMSAAFDRLLLITPRFFADLSILLVCRVLSSLGFAPTLQIVHPLSKLTHHPHPPQQYPQACPRALSLAHFFLCFSYHLLPM